MLQALHAEWQKARRRHDLVLCLTFAVILYLWLGSTAPTGQDELANAYSALFFGVPMRVSTLSATCSGATFSWPLTWYSQSSRKNFFPGSFNR